MRKLIACALLSASVIAAAPASAAIVLNGDGSLSVSSDTVVGDSYILNFDGSSSGSFIAGLTSQLLLTFNGFDGNSWVFGYDLTNTSGSPLTSANVMGFGFDVIAPNLLGADVEGDFNTVGSGPISNGLNVDVCFKNGQGNNCAGGGSSGFAMGSTASGNFMLDFASGTTNVTLDNFVVRYQGVNGPDLRDGSAVGVPVGAIPEPGTWAMLLVGFGAAGFAMRRRKSEAKARVRLTYA